jgi:hypothetical protein
VRRARRLRLRSVCGPPYPMSLTPPESVGPVPAHEVEPLLVNITVDASMKPVSAPLLTATLTCPDGGQ